MRDLLPEIEITGIETSKYAVENSMKTIKENVNFAKIIKN